MRSSESGIEAAQRAICARYSAEFTLVSGEIKSGFALSTKGLVPVNGLRHLPTSETTGWYIWSGESFSQAADFFAPLCTSHIYEDLPEVAKLLGLPPGYRFLLTDDYLDVWLDETLLDI